jgi:hypothetical protein
MATYYWVGGSGTWDTVSTANWSLTSGGAGGAGVPNAADVALIDANAGAGTITLGSNVSCLILNLTGFTGTLDFGAYEIAIYRLTGTAFTNVTTYTALGSKQINIAGNGASVGRDFLLGAPAEANALNVKISAGTDTVTISGASTLVNLDCTGFSGLLNFGSSNKTFYGNFKLSSGCSFAPANGAALFAATSGVKTIETFGKTTDCPFTFNGAGGTWQIVDSLTTGATRNFTLTNGTLDANDRNVAIGNFVLGAGTKTLTLGSGTWTVAGTSWNANTNVTGLTVSLSTGVISMTSASAKTFAGGGKTWPTLNQGGAGALTIQQANTFANITNTVQPATITFPASTITTVGAFGVSGTSGNLIELNSSTAGTRATISRASGLTDLSFVDIRDINATGQAFFSYLFEGNVDSGNNAGIRFNLPDSSTVPSMFI